MQTPKQTWGLIVPWGLSLLFLGTIVYLAQIYHPPSNLELLQSKTQISQNLDKALQAAIVAENKAILSHDPEQSKHFFCNSIKQHIF